MWNKSPQHHIAAVTLRFCRSNSGDLSRRRPWVPQVAMYLAKQLDLFFFAPVPLVRADPNKQTV
jgi:hypothetical protein